MNDTEHRSVARYVQTPLTPARIAGQWSVIAADTPRRRLPQWLVPAVSAVAVLVMTILLVLNVGRAPAPLTLAEGALLESGAVHAITLSDGSRVRLGEASRVRLVTSRADDVRIALEKGDTELDVTHVAGRRFTVTAGRFDVVIVGTSLRVVLAEAGVVTVSVTHGRVEVKNRDGSEPPRSISEGESWSSGSTAPSPTAVQDDPAAVPSAATTTSPSAEATSSAATAPTASASAPTWGSRIAGAGARELLEMAQDARVHGRARDAALALDSLRRRYRGDGRAGLAAFELARLRMDSFGDARGALEALEDAIALGGAAPYREDAEARRVAILDAMHAGGCAAARDAYLARYPHGARATSVAKRCGGK